MGFYLRLMVSTSNHTLILMKEGESCVIFVVSCSYDFYGILIKIQKQTRVPLNFTNFINKCNGGLKFQQVFSFCIDQSCRKLFFQKINIKNLFAKVSRVVHIFLDFVKDCSCTKYGVFKLLVSSFHSSK
jgi:hypothetical protein